MKCLAIATFLLFLQVGAPQDYTFSLKAIPEAPKLSALDYNSLPEYVRHLIAPTESIKEMKANSVMAATEATTKKELKTYGMNIVNDHGLIWNDINKPRAFYEVGETQEHRKNNEVQKVSDNETSSKNINRITKNGVNKTENISKTQKAIDNQIKNNTNKTDKQIRESENKSLKTENSLTDLVKAGTASKLESTTYKPVSNKITPINDKNKVNNENNIDATSKTSKNVFEESIAHNLTSNRTEKLMHDLEKAINDFIKDINTISNNFVIQGKTSNCNSTSDVPKIPVSELQNIFNDIIKNYSNVVNSNTTTTEDDLNTPNTNFEPSQYQPITEDVDSDVTAIGYYTTTDSITTVEEMMIGDSVDKSNIKEHGNSKDQLTKDGDNEKENEFNRTINNQANGLNATDFLRDLIDDGKFQQLLDESTAKYLKPFAERIGREIKNEVTMQLQDYFKSIKDETNQSNPIGSCPYASNNKFNKIEGKEIEDINDNNEESIELFADITTELPTTTDINPSVTANERISKLSTYINESYNNKFTELIETSELVKPTPQNIYICEACKVIFNMYSNVSTNYINADGFDTNDIFIKNKSKEEFNTKEELNTNSLDNNSHEIKNSPVKDDKNTLGSVDEIYKIVEQNANILNSGNESVDKKFIPQFTTETNLYRDEVDNANYREDTGTEKSNNANVLLGRSPFIRLPRLRVNL